MLGYLGIFSSVVSGNITTYCKWQLPPPSKRKSIATAVMEDAKMTV